MVKMNILRIILVSLLEYVMANSTKILGAIKAISAGSKASFEGVVDEVQLDRYTCTVTDILTGQRYFNVKLKSIADDDLSLIAVPKVNSFVTCLKITEQSFCVVLCDALDKIYLAGEDNDGIVKVKPLTDALNATEKKINDLIQVFQNWVPVPNDGGAALKSGLSSWTAQRLQETKKTDLENNKVLH